MMPRSIAVCPLLVVSALLVGLLLLPPGHLSAADPSPQQLEYFEQQVRPLLVKRCYECHSSEADAAEGGLRLDSRDGWESGGDSGPAIEAGNVAGSLLITAVRYDGLEMPPDGRLPAEEIAILERWVEMGAPDPRTAAALGVARGKSIDFGQARQFWSFQLPRRHVVPPVARHEWPQSDIDRFLLAKIEDVGLAPTNDADPRTWLRRVTFDLTGLPPTPEQLQAFLNDQSDDARSRVVDRLLASSAFGEHWGRHWLDVARYADTNGGDFNATFKSAWRYRDYVIAALNADKPFDEFVREQLAGDLLDWESDDERAEQLIATGFLMVGCKMLSERDKQKFRMDVVDEQIDTVGRAFLGLTLGCARCHDHKFDPLPTADYYALAGIFESTESFRGESQKYVSTWKEVELPVPPEAKTALEEHQQQTSRLQATIAALEAEQKSLGDRLKTLDPETGGVIVDDLQATLVGNWKKSTYSPRYFGEGYVHNDKQGLGEKSAMFRPTLPHAGEYEIRFAYAGSGGRATNVPVVVRHAMGEERLTVDQTRPGPIDQIWLSLGKFPFEQGAAGSVTVETTGTDGYVLADAMQFLPTSQPAEGEPAAEDKAAIARLRGQIADVAGQLETTEQQVKEHEAAAPPPIPTCMAVREQEQIGDSAIRIRGEVHREGDIIPRGFLSVLADDQRPQLNDTSQSGRLELADWIASADNPLTARVIVNRVWQHLFGRGIVPTVDNFGRLGQPPTHPDLLDTLAVEFIEDGWSLKRLIRRLVLSRTYGLSSLPPATAGENDTATVAGEHPDPANNLLTHARRRRLPAESIRDAMLAVSRQLERASGGSSVEPLAYLAITTSGKNSADLKIDENRRRSIYLPMVRNDLPEMLRLFDIADPELVTGRRPVTNVPAQALYLMNSPFVASAASQAAARIMESTTDDRQRLDRAYALLLSRVPTQAERERALHFLTADGEQSTPQAWSQFVHILLASTEFHMLD
jgi:hypothetical protein